MVRDMMEFQDRNEDFKIPFEPGAISKTKKNVDPDSKFYL